MNQNTLNWHNLHKSKRKKKEQGNQIRIRIQKKQLKQQQRQYREKKGFSHTKWVSGKHNFCCDITIGRDVSYALDYLGLQPMVGFLTVYTVN